ncbi:hypothetical protein D9M72_338270 [compost metagenome]
MQIGKLRCGQPIRIGALDLVFTERRTKSIELLNDIGCQQMHHGARDLRHQSEAPADAGDLQAIDFERCLRAGKMHQRLQEL